MGDLFEDRENIKAKISNVLEIEEQKVLKDKLEEKEKNIAEIQAETNFKTVKEQVEHLVDDTDNLNCIKMWQLKKKLGVKKKDVPVTKMNDKGELVTNSFKS